MFAAFLVILFVGFILLGNIDRAGIYTALVRERTSLSSIDFDLIRDTPQLMAFSATERAKKLGGETLRPLKQTACITRS